MAVEGGLNVRASTIERSVNEAFEVNAAAGSINGRAVSVVLENIFCGHQARRHAARHQEMLRVFLVAHTNVAEAVDDALIVEDAIGVDEILAESRFLT